MAPVCFVIRGRCQEMQDVGAAGPGEGCCWLRSVDGQREKRADICDGDEGRRRRRRRKEEIREQLKARAAEDEERRAPIV